MSVLGIDLAAGPKKTYACTLDERDGRLVAALHAACDDTTLLALARGRRKVAIDAPFGWPRPFVQALVAHRDFEAWPAPDDDQPEVFRAALSFRLTDRIVMHTRRPLSVSTDKLGVTAMRCAHLLLSPARAALSWSRATADARSSIPGNVQLEAECSSRLPGTPPTLDCLVDGPQVLAVESKCTEQFERHEAAFSDAYDGVVAERAHRSWQAEYARLCEDPRRYRFLDAAQLVKHYLGLRRRFADRPVTLAYLYWEPANAADVAACVVHAAEASDFAAKVGHPRVRFVAMPYPAVWAAWAADPQPGWLREHAAALRARYDVAV